jgi:hypothetical protein
MGIGAVVGCGGAASMHTDGSAVSPAGQPDASLDGAPVDAVAGDGGASPPAITGITFDWSTYQRLAPGSDNWPLTWCEDDHQYTSWGDGGGFGGTNSDGRVSLGFARLEGPYTSFRGINVWGGLSPENPAQFDGKSTSMVCIGGNLYAWRSDQSSKGSFEWKQLIRSTDKGATWEEDVFPDSRLTGCVGCPGIPYTINYGQNYTANRDGFVYTYTIRIEDPTTWNVQTPGEVWLARAPVTAEAWTDLAGWEWVTALDSTGSPSWGAIDDRASILSDAEGVMRGSAMYIPGLDRYIMVTNHTERNRGNIAFFEAPAPWGPWNEVFRASEWPDGDPGAPPSGDVARTFAFGNFSPKWLSTDGRQCVFVWFRPDAWNSVACEFQTSSH